MTGAGGAAPVPRLRHAGRPGRLAAGLREAANDDTDTATRPWDVRVTRLIDDADGQALLQRLLAVPSGGRLLGRPVVTRLAPAVSMPWLGTLTVVRVPVHVRDRRSAAPGYVQAMLLGAGATEVQVCLQGTSRADRILRWRRLGRVAELACDGLLPRPAGAAAAAPDIGPGPRGCRPPAGAAAERISAGAPAGRREPTVRARPGAGRCGPAAPRRCR